MPLVGIDANVLLRFLTEDQVNQQQTRLVMQVVSGGAEDLYINTVALVETFWVMKSVMRISRPLQAMALHALLAHPKVVLANRLQVIEAVNAFETGGPGFADHLIGALNIAAGCRSTLTFDKAAAKSPHFTQLS